ncbi:aminotransferase-like domain-containing protein [Aliamphritea hakodatensis]|uniref:aminotransferase-like domain-containing protein n=1 Tax=Aliamphritea hakodatensis TaxID=2895352 RepID=UPI0022FD5E13|nr:PLP-dependent aminotransferase family protein [Aliamphritea hakodatensis]
MFLYQVLEQQIREQIESGQLAFGSRLPSVRALCQEQDLSKATVLNAYARLEAAGLIEARPKSGYFVSYTTRRLELPAESKPDMAPAFISLDQVLLDIMEQSAAFDIRPDGKWDEYNEPLRRCLARAARSQKGQEQQYYDEPAGLSGLRHQLVRRCADAGSMVQADDIVISGGCQHSLMLALMATTSPGDTVAVESPGFYGSLQLIEALGLQAVEVPSSPATGVSPDALELAMQHWPIKAVLLSPNFATPTGACMPDSHKQRVLSLIRSKDIALIEDDIYGDLTFGLQRPRSIHSYDQEMGASGLVLLCSSFSKSLSRDLRVGWILPGRYKDKVKRLKLVTQLASSQLTQQGVRMFLESGSYDRFLRKRRQQLAEQCQQLQDLLARLFPQATGCSKPLGGIALWLELPEHVDTLALYNQARKQGIIITPGSLFTSQQRYQNCLRIGFAQPWTQARVAALEEIAQLLTGE